jgi:predicted dehydrogenase
VQTLHLPTLAELPGLFRVMALCDPSSTVLAGVSLPLRGVATFLDHREMLAAGGLDAVVIASPHALHAAQAIDCLAAGVHVLIEKPVALTIDDGAAIRAAQGTKVVQVGYMRRHAPAYAQAAGLIAAERGRINLARVRDIIGPNAAFSGVLGPVLRGDDIPAVVSAALRAAIGTDEHPRALVYGLLAGLSSHDLSAMRGLLGMPDRVLHATARRDGLFLTALFDYGDFVCQFETGIDDIPRFDACIEVMAQSRTIRLDYDTPYIRHQPARLTLTDADGPHGVRVTTGHPTRRDAFVAEWQAFHAAITAGAPVVCDVADAMQDLQLFADIMKLI